MARGGSSPLRRMTTGPLTTGLCVLAVVSTRRRGRASVSAVSRRDEEQPYRPAATRRQDCVLAGLLFSTRTSSTGSPASTAEFGHCASVIVEETAYFRMRLR